MTPRRVMMNNLTNEVRLRDLEQRVESLKLLKAGMDAAKYASELEKALTDLALKTQQIRTLEGKKSK